MIPLRNSSLAMDAGGAGLQKRMTGNYFWTLAIMLPTAALGGLAVYIILFGIHDVAGGGSWSWFVALAVAALALVAEDHLYFGLSEFTQTSPTHEAACHLVVAGGRRLGSELDCAARTVSHSDLLSNVKGKSSTSPL